jgi:V/A-type H+-transporting ATPase subunit K
MKFGTIVFLVALGLMCTLVYAQEAAAPIAGITYSEDFKTFGLAIGIGLAMGLSAVGAGIGIGYAGAAGIGAIAEKPEVATWALIMVALAEGIALYGLVIAFMLIGKL